MPAYTAPVEELIHPDQHSLTAFLTRWYGPPTTDPGRSTITAVPIPTALSEWYRTTSRWSTQLVFHNRVVPPHEIKIAQGKVLFWVENQGCCYWATDATSESSAVYVREEWGPDSAWRQICESLESFLLHVIVDEAITGALTRLAVEGPVDEVEAMMESFTRLEFPALETQHPETYLLSDGRTLVKATPMHWREGRDRFLQYTFAAKNEGALLTYAQHLRQWIKHPPQPYVQGDLPEEPPF